MPLILRPPQIKFEIKKILIIPTHTTGSKQYIKLTIDIQHSHLLRSCETLTHEVVVHMRIVADESDLCSRVTG